MRNSRVLALVVASLVSTASFVGAQAPAAAPHGGRHAMGRGVRGGQDGERGPLRGLTLNAAEQAKVKEINAKYAAETKQLRESFKPVMQEAKALRQKGDTAGLRALMEKNKAGREQLQALQAKRQAEIRGALSAANQKQFDTNVAAQAKRRAEWEKSGKAGRHVGERGGKRVRGAAQGR